MKRNYFEIGKKQFANRKDAILQVIRKYQPDIIGTQELTALTLRQISTELGDYVWVGTGRGGGTKGEYTAVLYKKDKFKLKREKTFWLSSTPDKPSRGVLALCPRICTTCQLSLLEDETQILNLYNTHLDHISYWARVRGLEQITKEVQEQSEMPTIIMGDFNAAPTSQTIKKWQKQSHQDVNLQFQSIYNACEEGKACRSYHGFVGKTEGYPIDYIFVTDNIGIDEVCICRDQVNGYFPSDHYPIFTKLHLTKNKDKSCH